MYRYDDGGEWETWVVTDPHDHRMGVEGLVEITDERMGGVR